MSFEPAFVNEDAEKKIAVGIKKAFKLPSVNKVVSVLRELQGVKGSKENPYKALGRARSNVQPAVSVVVPPALVDTDSAEFLKLFINESLDDIDHTSLSLELQDFTDCHLDHISDLGNVLEQRGWDGVVDEIVASDRLNTANFVVGGFKSILVYLFGKRLSLFAETLVSDDPKVHTDYYVSVLLKMVEHRVRESEQQELTRELDELVYDHIGTTEEISDNVNNQGWQVQIPALIEAGAVEALREVFVEVTGRDLDVFGDIQKAQQGGFSKSVKVPHMDRKITWVSWLEPAVSEYSSDLEMSLLTIDAEVLRKILAARDLLMAQQSMGIVELMLDGDKVTCHKLDSEKMDDYLRNNEQVDPSVDVEECVYLDNNRESTRMAVGIKAISVTSRHIQIQAVAKHCGTAETVYSPSLDISMLDKFFANPREYEGVKYIYTDSDSCQFI